MYVPKIVSVSPHYRGNGWTDDKTGIQFKPGDINITIPDGADITNIMKYIRFNYLLDQSHIQEISKPNLQEVVKSPSANVLMKKDYFVPSKERLNKAEVSDKEDNTCPYCGKEFAKKGLAPHMRFCKQNPENKVE